LSFCIKKVPPKDDIKFTSVESRQVAANKLSFETVQAKVGLSNPIRSYIEMASRGRIILSVDGERVVVSVDGERVVVSVDGGRVVVSVDGERVVVSVDGERVVVSVDGGRVVVSVDGERVVESVDGERGAESVCINVRADSGCVLEVSGVPSGRTESGLLICWSFPFSPSAINCWSNWSGGKRWGFGCGVEVGFFSSVFFFAWIFH
jgi:hypothetical protein